ncbi:hypothetical protein C4573_04225 [Candidatus Woesearchaeota archaeon]|nr:MAG: hypothetical protein C4573_04225 [Candidatus Woesearchaeota archaeon]
MNIGKTLYVQDRRAWRAWLKKNHRKEKDIWLIYYAKLSGKKRIPYNDAVEEALCYGWIDSTVKSVDKESFAQRFTPRKSRAVSELNKERIRKLIGQKKMTSFGLTAVNFNPDESFAIAKDILAALKKNHAAWKHFQNFPDSYKRVRIGYLEGQRKHSKVAFQKSLAYFLKMTEKNKRFGFLRE